jgi:transcriptional regulator with XRE-family HTH domain
MALKTVNDRIKQVRRELDLSQKAFCTGIFLSPGHYAEIELNNRAANEIADDAVFKDYSSRKAPKTQPV